MAEPQDAFMPVLQKIQKDISDFRKSMEAKVNDIAENVLEIKEDAAKTNRYLSHHMGVTMQHRSDFEDLQAIVLDLQARLKSVESRL